MKPITDKDLKRILIKAYVTNEDLLQFNDTIIDSINSIVKDNVLSDIDMIQRTEERWNIILTFEDDSEYLYNLNMVELLNI